MLVVNGHNVQAFLILWLPFVNHAVRTICRTIYHNQYQAFLSDINRLEEGGFPQQTMFSLSASVLLRTFEKKDFANCTLNSVYAIYRSNAYCDTLSPAMCRATILVLFSLYNC